MRRLIAFEHLSLDGYFVDRNGEMTWAKQDNDAEFNAFTTENAMGGGVLLFGRVTYDLMVSFWPTPQASQSFPVVAERMQNSPKVVFSRTLKHASWNNTQLVGGDYGSRDNVTADLVTAVRNMKREPGEGMVILGSGSIVSQLAWAGLIDEFQIIINPIALGGGGRTLFEGIRERLALQLTNSRVFRNGRVFLCYEPTA
jgi:dihydrofolate reductase